MKVTYKNEFLVDIRRIDKKIIIDYFREATNPESPLYIPEVICQGKRLKICLNNLDEFISDNVQGLLFYYGEGREGFTISDENGIILDKYRTIFEFDLPDDTKAIIEGNNTEDIKFLEGPSLDLGKNLYNDIKISSDSLVWKGTLEKYIVDKGVNDNHLYDVELFDTKSGILEERPIKFKSYQNIKIEQGTWNVDMISRSVVVKHDVYSEISDVSFLVWDSPMIDAKVDLSKEPVCIDKIGEYVDPGDVIYGNTDCFQFTNYSSSLVGFRITGIEGSNIKILFNRESTNGEYSSFSGIIGEDGILEIRFSELPYLHFNGIVAVGPSKVTNIETIMYLEEIVDENIPNPDKTLIASVNNEDCTVKINGTADYIEYEKYLGEIHEIGRGTDHIDNISGLMIRRLDEDGGLTSEVDELDKQINVEKNIDLGADIRYAIFQVTIDNNVNVNNNTITTSTISADYKIKIEQTGIIWKIYESPDYVNRIDGCGIYLLDSTENFIRGISLITNNPSEVGSILVDQPEDSSAIFEIRGTSSGATIIIDGEVWKKYEYSIKTLSSNEDASWRPKDNNDPIKITFKSENTDLASFYAIQTKEMSDRIEIWEETVIPGQFSKVGSNITISNSMRKNFVVIKKTGGSKVTRSNWYYYDLTGNNQFYLTDQNYQTSNIGLEYLLAPDSSGNYPDILELGTAEERSIYGRVINVNRSDSIGSLGSLVVTESPAYPGSWKDVIDNNTASIEITRELDNIYIQVGESEEDLKNEDLTVEVDRIKTITLNIRSNFKYIIQTYGYIKLYSSNVGKSSSSKDFPTRAEIISDYNNPENKFNFALTKLDEDLEMENSYIEVRSGDVVRKITLKVKDIKREHNYLLYNEDEKPIQKPNLIKIFNNGTTSTGFREVFFYTSTTTPKLEVSGINKTGEDIESFFGNDHVVDYMHHESKLSFSILNSNTLKNSKYPMKSFGYVREMSKDFSDSETVNGIPSYLEFPFYMKGKEHYIWCVETLNNLYSITDPNSGTVIKDIVLDASSDEGRTIYVVSRYSIDNQTFITEYPVESEFKIKRNKLEADIKISQQQKIALDETSQIEYAIPIQVNCNVENNDGNIFLGSLEYKAKTEITENSVEDVIDISSDIISREVLPSTEENPYPYSDYIKKYITPNNAQELNIRIFQRGTSPNIFDIYSGIPDLGILPTSNYVIPEIGSNYIINSLDIKTIPSEGDEVFDISDYNKSGDPPVPVKYETLDLALEAVPVNEQKGGMTIRYIDSIGRYQLYRLRIEDWSSNVDDWEKINIDIVTIQSECDSTYFLIKVDSSNRVSEGEYWYNSNNLPFNNIINDLRFDLKITAKYTDTSITTTNNNEEEEETGEATSTPLSKEFEVEFNEDFKKYGCHYGLYVGYAEDGHAEEGHAGFGVMSDNYYNTDLEGNIKLPVDSSGGSIKIHAGIFYAIDGISTSEALIVPSEYKFIGENQPLDFTWTDGNLDDDGNLQIVLPPRTRNEVGNKNYILQVTQPDEYYPLNLYIIFYQEPLEDDEEEEEMKYKLMFLDNEVNILSNGSVVGNEEGKFKFVHNLPESEFNKVTFRWKQKNGDDIPTSPDNLSIKEVERSFEDGYVKFKFKPNGSSTFIDANIQACYSYRGQVEVIGELSAKQGYFCLAYKYQNPHLFDLLKATTKQNSMSRVSPISNTLYSYNESDTTISSSVSETPCKSNNNNASSSIITGRGVFKLIPLKREYYDSEYVECEISNIFKSSEILFISPETILESYELNFVSDSSNSDKDAEVDSRFNNNKNRATDTVFGKYSPYIELSYLIKDNYLRQDNIITASGKITLKHPDFGELVDFYILITNKITGSDEPQDISLLRFSENTLNFDYRGGDKQISFSPASFASMFNIEAISGSTWLSIQSIVSGSNYLMFRASTNRTTETVLAFFRTAQFKINVEDTRKGSTKILGSYYINASQEPDITQTSGGEGGDTNTVPIILRFVNSRRSRIYLTGKVELILNEEGNPIINSDLPGASTQENRYQLNSGDSFEYTVRCTSTIDPRRYLDTLISECNVYAYNSGEGSISWKTLLPYYITRNNSNDLRFVENGEYTITFTDDVPITLNIKNDRSDTIRTSQFTFSTGNSSTNENYHLIKCDFSTVTVNTGETKSIEVNCTSTSNPKNYLRLPITEWSVYSRGSSIIRPTSLARVDKESLTIESGGKYTITVLDLINIERVSIFNNRSQTIYFTGKIKLFVVTTTLPPLVTIECGLSGASDSENIYHIESGSAIVEDNIVCVSPNNNRKYLVGGSSIINTCKMSYIDGNTGEEIWEEVNIRREDPDSPKILKEDEKYIIEFTD